MLVREFLTDGVAVEQLTDAHLRGEDFQLVLLRLLLDAVDLAAGLDLPGGACWILTMLAKQGATPGPELARQAGVTMEEGHPNAQLLVDRDLITRNDGTLALTPAGTETADRLFAAQHDWLEHQLAGWSPEQHAELEHVLAKLSRAMLGEESDRRLSAR